MKEIKNILPLDQVLGILSNVRSSTFEGRQEAETDEIYEGRAKEFVKNSGANDANFIDTIDFVRDAYDKQIVAQSDNASKIDAKKKLKKSKEDERDRKINNVQSNAGVLAELRQEKNTAQVELNTIANENWLDEKDKEYFKNYSFLRYLLTFLGIFCVLGFFESAIQAGIMIFAVEDVFNLVLINLAGSLVGTWFLYLHDQAKYEAEGLAEELERLNERKKQSKKTLDDDIFATKSNSTSLTAKWFAEHTDVKQVRDGKPDEYKIKKSGIGSFFVVLGFIVCLAKSGWFLKAAFMRHSLSPELLSTGALAFCIIGTLVIATAIIFLGLFYMHYFFRGVRHKRWLPSSLKKEYTQKSKEILSLEKQIKAIPSGDANGIRQTYEGTINSIQKDIDDLSRTEEDTNWKSYIQCFKEIIDTLEQKTGLPLKKLRDALGVNQQQ
ncbi:MAG: hypothetical protein LBO09_06780 [Candidatus Peribacteria bacterium]|jgi:hypothetical protein|nr:hypothetical protein [Candidatus Peribacteria bacterium]